MLLNNYEIAIVQAFLKANLVVHNCNLYKGNNSVYKKKDIFFEKKKVHYHNTFR